MSLVSILIPAYNAGRFIERALESVRMQTLAEWEVIVVEDGSQDETQALVTKFAAEVPQMVRYERATENRGVSATRNRLLELARGKYLAFLDADDFWKPEHLASGVATLEHGADLCFSGFLIFDLDTGETVTPPLVDLAAMGDVAARLFRSNFIQTSSLVMMRASAVRKTGLFDPQLAIGEDCDYWIRIISMGGRLACTGARTCVYTKHGKSAMAEPFRVAEHGVRFYRKHLENAVLPRVLRRRLYAQSLFNLARLIARADAHCARSLFLKAWRLRPWDLRCPAFIARTWMLGYKSH
ncbi:MAG: glycosyltransferase family 2 protein [Chthoniobacteraceae bacterium]